MKEDDVDYGKALSGDMRLRGYDWSADFSAPPFSDANRFGGSGAGNHPMEGGNQQMPPIDEEDDGPLAGQLPCIMLVPRSSILPSQGEPSSQPPLPFLAPELPSPLPSGMRAMPEGWFFVPYHAAHPTSC